MPKCRFCNHDVPNDKYLCPNCGAPVDTAAPPPAGTLEHDASPASPLPPDDAMEAELLQLLQSGNKIEATKIYRQRTGVTLIDAKQAVEALAKKHGVASQGGGCAGVLLAIVFAVAVISTVMS